MLCYWLASDEILHLLLLHYLRRTLSVSHCTRQKWSKRRRVRRCSAWFFGAFQKCLLKTGTVMRTVKPMVLVIESAVERSRPCSIYSLYIWRRHCCDQNAWLISFFGRPRRGGGLGHPYSNKSTSCTWHFFCIPLAQVTSHDGERSEYAAPNASKRAQTRGCAVATAPGPIFEVPSQLETVMQ